MKKYLLKMSAVIFAIFLTAFSSNKQSYFDFYYFDITSDGMWFERPYEWVPVYSAQSPNCDGFGLYYCSAGLHSSDVEFSGDHGYVRPSNSFYPVYIIAMVLTFREE